MPTKKPMPTLKLSDPRSQELLLSRKDVARRWGCHIETVKRWEADGRLKAIKIGGKFLRYRLSDIEQLELEGVK